MQKKRRQKSHAWAPLTSVTRFKNRDFGGGRAGEGLNSDLVITGKAEMRYCEIRKEMSSLYFGLAVFRLFEARVPEFDTQPLPPVQCTYTTDTLNTASNSGTLASNWQHKSSPKYKDDCSLILEYLIYVERSLK